MPTSNLCFSCSSLVLLSPVPPTFGLRGHGGVVHDVNGDGGFVVDFERQVR